MTGETYKQGKFSSSEDKLIKATIKNYRERSGMTSEELVTHINTRKVAASKDPFASLSSGSDGKKLTNSSSSGPLNELWLELGNALQERALLGIWNHVRRMYNPDAQKGSWSVEEDEKLKKMIKKVILFITYSRFFTRYPSWTARFKISRPLRKGDWIIESLSFCLISFFSKYSG